MTDRELMQQVLEDICGAKLCEINSMSSRVEMIRLLDNATAALRERLAQPEQPSVPWSAALESVWGEPEREPVAWMHNDIRGNVITHRPADLARHPERWTPLYTAPPQRTWAGSGDLEDSNAYLTPPQRKPLTDEEIDAEWRELDGEASALFKHVIRKYARAIEAKLKEKNT